MWEFKLTFSDVQDMTWFQLTFLLEGLADHYEKEARAARKASKRK